MNVLLLVAVVGTWCEARFPGSRRIARTCHNVLCSRVTDPTRHQNLDLTPTSVERAVHTLAYLLVFRIYFYTHYSMPGPVSIGMGERSGFQLPLRETYLNI